jgi:hypothetical protein
MEALQSGQNSGGLPPAALPSPTPAATASLEAPTAISSPSAEPIVDLPTEIAITAEPSPMPTIELTAAPAPPTATPEATLVLPTQVPLTNEQRWRAQQIERVVFDPMRSYTTVSSELWWYDPVNQQHVILGTFTGSFVAQARFTLRGQGVEALEVPYQVNKSYGLTALSTALVDRIKTAGNSEWVETYVFVTPNITP